MGQVTEIKQLREPTPLRSRKRFWTYLLFILLTLVLLGLISLRPL